MEQEPIKKTYPYIPWKTFTNFVERLKTTAIPSVIDNSVMPNLAVQIRGQVRSALRFLSLTDENDVVSTRFRSLVQVYNTDEWSGALRAVIEPAYATILNGITLSEATPRQIESRFRDEGGVSGQMLDKCVRFFLAAMESAGAVISHHLTARQPRTGNGTAKAKKKTKQADSSPIGEQEDELENRPGMKVFSFPVHEKNVRISIPDDLDEAYWQLINTAVLGYVKLRSKKQEGGGS